MGETPYSVAIESMGQYLLASASGRRTRQSVVALTMEIFRAALDAGLSKVLVDVTALEGRLGVLDSFLVVSDAFGVIRGRGVSQAAIVDRSMRPVRGWFLETVAVNRGYNIRVFEDRQAAAEWLTK
jgi:hypothetical protein